MEPIPSTTTQKKILNLNIKGNPFLQLTERQKKQNSTVKSDTDQGIKNSPLTNHTDQSYREKVVDQTSFGVLELPTTRRKIVE